MKFVLSVLISAALSVGLLVSNPICPPGVYFADPSARVIDGRLYLFGSTDESTDYYCSYRHDVFYSDNVRDWGILTNIFKSKGSGDSLPYNDNLLFAPDCIEKDGKYYLYYCQPDKEHAEGTAVADSPGGPFRDVRPLETYGYNQIDPAVFIDDDGAAYYLWGQFDLKIARLKEDMRSIDSASIIDSLLTEEEHFFHEGAYMTKIGELYYIVYADISREDKPTCIGYSTSRNPLGPYKYRGVIIDNDGCNPGNWNNHGSITEFGGRYFVFYHRSTHGVKTMRKACLEEIEVLADGSIPEVEMTSSGPNGPIDAFQTIDAARACLLHGGCRIESVSDSDEAVTRMRSGNSAIYKYVNFKKPPRSITIRFKAKENLKILIAAEKPWHKRLGLIDIEVDADTDKWRTETFDIEGITGEYALWIQTYGNNNSAELMQIDWFKFNE